MKLKLSEIKYFKKSFTTLTDVCFLAYPPHIVITVGHSYLPISLSYCVLYNDKTKDIMFDHIETFCELEDLLSEFRFRHIEFTTDDGNIIFYKELKSYIYDNYKNTLEFLNVDMQKFAKNGGFEVCEKCIDESYGIEDCSIHFNLDCKCHNILKVYNDFNLSLDVFIEDFSNQYFRHSFYVLYKAGFLTSAENLKDIRRASIARSSRPRNSRRI